MPRMGFTGTRSVPFDRVADVLAFLTRESHEFDEFTTGACTGFDAIAAHYLIDQNPNALHRLVVPANRSQVDGEIIERFRRLEDDRHVIEYMPEGTSYRERNERILDHSDALLAVADHPEIHSKSVRSGTWMTVRIARRRGIPIEGLVLWPAI